MLTQIGDRVVVGRGVGGGEDHFDLDLCRLQIQLFHFLHYTFWRSNPVILIYSPFSVGVSPRSKIRSNIVNQLPNSQNFVLS